MLTGEIRNQIDRIWDAFWSGGISNPLEVIEQITYLLFSIDSERSHQNQVVADVQATRRRAAAGWAAPWWVSRGVEKA